MGGYGFKLHIICNGKGETINFIITKRNIADREPLKNKYFLNKFIKKAMALPLCKSITTHKNLC